MRGRCPTRISRTDVIGPATPHRGFWITLGQFPNNWPIISSPTVDKYGTIYVGTDGEGLVALWPDGGTRWSYAASTGAVRAGGTIVADDSIISADSSGNIVSLDRDGNVNWSTNVSYAVSDAPLVGPDGTLYFGDQNGKFYALHSDGGTWWTQKPSLGAIFGGATQGSDGYILVSDSSTIWRLAPDGGSVPTGFGPGVNSIVDSPVTVGPEGTIWYGSQDGYVCASTPSGTKLFQIPYAFVGVNHFFNGPAAGFDDRVFFAGPGGTGSQTVDRTIYSATNDGGSSTVYVLDAGVQAQLLIDGAGNIYAVSGQDLVSIAPDGGLNWSFNVAGEVQTGIAMGADGTIYVGTVEGSVMSITP